MASSGWYCPDLEKVTSYLSKPYPSWAGSGISLNKLLIFLIVAWSGYYVMSIELLSGRILAPSFGSSIYVWGAVITIFMLALSAGYLLGGRLSVAEPSLKKLAILLLLAAVATTPVMLIGERVQDEIFVRIHDPRYGSMVSILLLFSLPTLLSGMVSPYAVRLLVSEHRLCGQYSGLLYSVSTFGSAVGTLLTSFYLVLYFEIFQIIWIMIGISTLLGVFALVFGKDYDVKNA
jgi:hypothetical protein